MSHRRSPNRDRLIRTVRRLEPLLDRFVFVGGQVVELLVTDPAAARPRVTDDVDVVVGVSTRAAYARIEEQLRTLGFQPDVRAGAPLCRFRTTDDLVLDVMPLDEDVLGFSNRWYAAAIDSPHEVELEPGVKIQVISAVVFLATKWEAYRVRGAGAPMMSRDVQDLIAVVAGRRSIVEELRSAPHELRQFVAGATRDFLGDAAAEEVIIDAIPDAVRFPDRLREALVRLHTIGRE